MNRKKIAAGFISFALMMQSCVFAVSAAEENKTANFEYDDFSVSYSVTNSYGNTEVVSLTLTNTGNETIEDWMLYFEPNGDIQYVTNATEMTAENGKMYFKNNGYNADIAPSSAVTFTYAVNDCTEIPDYYALCQTRVEKTEGYDVSLSVGESWGDSFNGSIVITNHTDKPIEAWELSIDTNFTITEISNSWAATVTELDEYQYLLKGTYTSTIAANSSVSLGFIGVKSGEPEISSYSLTEMKENLVLNEESDEINLRASTKKLSNEDDNQVTFYAETLLEVDEINLVSLDTNTVVGVLKDDGDLYNSGDEYMNDGVYTALCQGIAVSAINIDVMLSSNTQRLLADSEEMSVLFTAETAANVDSISLMDASTNQEVAVLYDDGAATYPNDGDLYENDGVYSNYLDLSGNQVGDYSYYAQYTVNGKTYTSDTVTVRVYRQFTEQELADMQKITDTLNALINSEEYAALSVEKKVKALSDRINSLAEVDETLGYALVDADSIRYNNVTYQFEFKDYIGLNYVYYAYTIPNTDATDNSAFTYVNHGDSIEITGFDNSVSDVVIPSEIEGLPVTAISVGAFYLSTITSIEVPDSVTSIGEMAFLGCTSLKSVKLSTGVAKIDKNAFGSCSALQEIQVAKDNPNFSSLNGVLYSKKQDTLVIYPAAKTDAAYIIPSGVTSVAMYAFSENPYLETLTIPNSLIKVGDSAFYNCKNLRAVSYNGTEEEWNQITIGLLNEKLTGATIQYQERIIGDVNADGAFTVSDVVLLQKWLLSVPDTQLADWKAADFNGDQTLNVFDLCQMRYNLLKQEEDSKR